MALGTNVADHTPHKDLPHIADPQRLVLLSREVDYFDDYADLWRTKLNECHPRFLRSIDRLGVISPVRLRFTGRRVYLAEGHHRWVAAKKLGHFVPWVDADLDRSVFERSLPWADGNSAAWPAQLTHTLLL